MSDMLKNLVDVCADPELEGVLTNLAGGEASAFDDPAELMLTLVGNNVFTEGYYDDALDQKQRKAGVGFEQLPPRARLLVSTAQEIARGDNPRDLLALASWGRQEANMRVTPQWLLAVATREPKTKQFVVDYCAQKTGIILRTDDILEVFKAYVTLYGSPLPNCLKKGLAMAYTRQSEYGLLKYNPDTWPRHIDVLRMADRHKDYPLSSAMVEFLNSGKVVDPEATPLLAARKQLYSMKVLDEEAIELAKKTRATWENLSSQFGGTKEVWELGVEIMCGKTSLDDKPARTNYMAVLRNLCNMAEAGINGAHWLMVTSLLTNEKEVANSKQWPYRWLSAYDQVMENRAFAQEPGIRQKVVNALDKAIQVASRNIFNFYGTTVISPDHSGSMSGSYRRENNGPVPRTAADVASVLAYYASEKAYVIPFGQEAKNVQMDPEVGFFENLKRVQKCDVGHATYGDKTIGVMNHMGIEADRVIYFTDEEIYGDMTQAWYDYRKNTNPECWMHVINLAGYGDKAGSSKQLDQTLQTRQGGYSEKLLNFCVRAELSRKQKKLVNSLPLPDEEKAKLVTTSELPSMDYIRQNF